MKTTQFATDAPQLKVKPSILYVDDEEINLKVFRSTFKRHYNVITCTSGSEALEILREQSVDLLLTDQRMPEMNGTELLSKVVPTHPDILRMIMTGFSDLEVIIKAVNEVGIHQYITKPWDFEALKSVFDNHLQRTSSRGIDSDTSERKQITRYAEGFVNKRNEEGFDLLNKHFRSAYLYNHSRSCNGEKNLFVHEFKKGDAIVTFILGCSVTGMRGSMLKSFVGDIAKELLLAKGAFNPANFYKDLKKASEDFLKDIEIEKEEISINMIYKYDGKPVTWVLSGQDSLRGVLEGNAVMLPPHTVNDDDCMRIFRLNKDICDKFYLYIIDDDHPVEELKNRMTGRIADLNTGEDMEIMKVELSSYLDHETTAHHIDKLTLLEIAL